MTNRKLNAFDMNISRPAAYPLEKSAPHAPIVLKFPQAAVTIAVMQPIRQSTDRAALGSKARHRQPNQIVSLERKEVVMPTHNDETGKIFTEIISNNASRSSFRPVASASKAIYPPAAADTLLMKSTGQTILWP